MTTIQFRKLEKIASEGNKALLKARKKQFELETLLSVEEYKQGKFTSYKNVKELFKDLGLKTK